MNPGSGYGGIQFELIMQLVIRGDLESSLQHVLDPRVCVTVFSACCITRRTRRTRPCDAMSTAPCPVHTALLP